MLILNTDANADQILNILYSDENVSRLSGSLSDAVKTERGSIPHNYLCIFVSIITSVLVTLCTRWVLYIVHRTFHHIKCWSMLMPYHYIHFVQGGNGVFPESHKYWRRYQVSSSNHLPDLASSLLCSSLCIYYVLCTIYITSQCTFHHQQFQWTAGPR